MADSKVPKPAPSAESIRQRMTEVGTKALEELKRRGVSDAEIQAHLKRKKRPKR